VSAFACFRFEGDPDFEGNIREVLYWSVESVRECVFRQSDGQKVMNYKYGLNVKVGAWGAVFWPRCGE
jgi:hypothetical protein